MCFKRTVNKDNRYPRKLKVIKEEDYNFKAKNKNLGHFIKKGIVIFGLSFILWSSLKEKGEYKPQISINEEYNGENYFATYSLGKVYICKQKDFEKVCLLTEPKDIIVIDKKDGVNPDMCIYNSFMVDNPQVIDEILIILQEYESKYPTDWSRTIESMHNEWIIHNLLYNLRIKLESTTHVDLDNEDEAIFASPLLTKILNK